MLTTDHIRATRRKGVVYPRFVKPENPKLQKLAQLLVTTFEEAHEQRLTWGEIDELLRPVVAQHSDPVLVRGLVKLLRDRSEVGVPDGLDPGALREVVFSRAARLDHMREPGVSWEQMRGKLLQEVAAHFGAPPEDVEHHLYADLLSRQRLLSFEALSGEQLLHRYNLSLAQAILLKARKLRIEIESENVGALRALFNALKFRQLIHTVVQDETGRIDIEVDGPLSIFSGSGRYGLAMALFLPSLLAFTSWNLVAELRWGKRGDAATFRLDASSGLQAQARVRGAYVTQEQQWFEERFEKSRGTWSMTRDVDILRTPSGHVVVPDLKFEHAQDGRIGHLEIIGYWRKSSLQKRLDALEEPALQNLIVAVSRSLSTNNGEVLPEHPHIVRFSNIISTKQVLEKLEIVARAPHI